MCAYVCESACVGALRVQAKGKSLPLLDRPPNFWRVFVGLEAGMPGHGSNRDGFASSTDG